jgi:antitoxin component YwqK of YwqJK toxin-antitoxin module
VKKELMHLKGRPHGLSKEYFPSGILSIEANYVEGYLTGNYKVYYEDGQLDTESHLQNGTKNGGFISYFRNGKKKLEGYYLDGKYHGEFQTYFPEGGLKSKITWQSGRMDGPAFYYYPDGRVQEELEYEDDKKKKIKAFYPNGQEEFIGTFTNGEKKSGKWSFYFPDGKKKEILTYNELGKQHGIRQVWDSTNVKILEEEWLNDLKTGKSCTFYRNGKVKDVFLFQGNYLQGAYQQFHPNGKLAVQGTYKNNKKNLQWDFYTEEGSPVKVETWRMDKLIGSRTSKAKVKPGGKK